MITEMKNTHIAALELAAVNTFTEMFPASTVQEVQKIYKLIEAIQQSVIEEQDVSAEEVLQALYQKYGV